MAEAHLLTSWGRVMHADAYEQPGGGQQDVQWTHPYTPPAPPTPPTPPTHPLQQAAPNQITWSSAPQTFPVAAPSYEPMVPLAGPTPPAAFLPTAFAPVSAQHVADTEKQGRRSTTLVLLTIMLGLMVALVFVVARHRQISNEAEAAGVPQPQPAQNLPPVQPGQPVQEPTAVPPPSLPDPAHRGEPVAATLTDTDGNDVNTSDMQGKPTVLLYWATWCGECRVDMPNQNIIREATSDRSNYMAVAEAAERDAALAYATENAPALPVYFDDGSMAQLLGINWIPTTTIVDTSGRVAYQVSGPVDVNTVVAVIDALAAE